MIIASPEGLTNNLLKLALAPHYDDIDFLEPQGLSLGDLSPEQWVVVDQGIFQRLHQNPDNFDKLKKHQQVIILTDENLSEELLTEVPNWKKVQKPFKPKELQEIIQ